MITKVEPLYDGQDTIGEVKFILYKKVPFIQVCFQYILGPTHTKGVSSHKGYTQFKGFL